MDVNPVKWTWQRIVLTSLAIGALAGAVFSSADLLVNNANPSSAQAAQLILCFVVLSAVIAGPALALLTLLLRQARWAPSEDLILSCTAGLGIQLAFVHILEPQQATVMFPISWVVALSMHRMWSVPGEPRFGARAVAICLYAAIAAPLLLLAGGLRGGTILVAIKLLGVITPAVVLQWTAARFPLVVSGALVIALAFIQWTGTQSRTWRTEKVMATGLEGYTDAKAPRTGDGSAASEQPTSPTPVKAHAANVALNPNVVIIVLDTTRADRLGCYGHTGKLTPHLDAFATESMLYEQAVSSAPWTVPSHASLFTGWYTVTHGCDNEPHRWLDSGFVTLAEMLRVIGYETVGIACNGYLIEANLLQGFAYQLNLDQSSGHRGTKMYSMMSKGGAPYQWSDQGAFESVASLSKWFDGRKVPERPFFVFVNLMEAHWPLRPPYEERKKQLMPGMGYLEATKIAQRSYGPAWSAGARRTPREEEAYRRLYNAEIAYQDSQLGALLDVLRSQTEFDNTLVIITADHGEHQGENHNWSHEYSVGEPLIHVPLIVRYPTLFPKGQRIAGQCQLVDIVPTVFDVLGTPCPVQGLPGRTLVPERFQPREYTYAEVHPYYGHAERLTKIVGLKRDIVEFLGYRRTVRTNQYKFVWSDRGEHHLYDIAADPLEAHDVIDEFPDVAARLEAHMAAWWKAQPPYEPRDIDEATPSREDALRGLRGLGYVGDK